jgi:Tfp pilus assembly protein PilX
MDNKKGQTLFAVVVFLGIIFIFSIGLLAYVMNNRLVSNRMYNSMRALNIAEAGANKAIWCLNNTDVCGEGYTGETTNFGAGEYTTTLTSTVNGYTARSTGTVQNISKTIKVSISDQPVASGASFHYGVQVGAGGLIMDNNAEIFGNVYSNGNITAGANAKIHGSTYVAGGTALNPDQQQTQYTSGFEVGRTSSQTDVAQSFKAGETNVLNKISLYLKKVGSPSNATIYIVNDNNGDPDTTPLTSGALTASLVTTDYSWIDVTFSSSPALTLDNKYWIVFDVGASNTNKYWLLGSHGNLGYGNGEGKYTYRWDVDNWNSAEADFGFKTWMGGILTKITGLTVPYVIGNIVHANTIENADISADTKCKIMDSTTVAGNIECGDVDNATVAGNVTAKNVINSTISGDLTCKTENNNNVTGSTYCPTEVTPPDDLPPQNMPVSEAQIEDWKNVAKVYNIPSEDCTDGTYSPVDQEVLGPVKIDCDLNIGTNGITVYINGPVWVNGDITIDNGVTVSLSNDFGENSTVIIADYPVNRNTKGKIIIKNNADVTGSGTESSYIMLVSTNTYMTPNTEDVAISVNNNVTGAILYTTQGMIEIANQAHLKEATGFALHLAQVTQVTYESGLANVNFANGPGGIWTTQESTWQEIN